MIIFIVYSCCYHVFVLKCLQLLKAAEYGRADDVLELMGEGANIEFKDRVRASFFCVHLIRIRMLSLPASAELVFCSLKLVKGAGHPFQNLEQTS